MVTTLPRTQVTHTAPIQHALSVAATRWPQYSTRPSALLRNLILEGSRSLESSGDPLAGLKVFSKTGKPIDVAKIEQALNDEA
jgi:hypothetical protein